MKQLATIIIALILPVIGICQHDKEAIFLKDVLKESLIIHTDRQIYLTGEEIYFKIQFNKEVSNPLSSIFYIELYDKYGKASVQKKFEIKNGQAYGILTIPEELISDNYYLRAYTFYQRNITPDYYYTKMLTIVNPENSLSAPPHYTSGDIEVYPSPTEDNLYFIKMAEHIRNQITRTYLTNNRKDTLNTLNLFKNGLGEMQIPASDSTSFSIHFSFEHGKEVHIPIQKNDGKEIDINLKETKTNLELHIVKMGSSQLVNINFYDFWKNPITTKSLNISETVQSISFLKEKLPAGLFWILISDSQGNILKKKLSYIAQNKTLNTEIKIAKKSKTRSKVDLQLLAENFEGQISVSVRKDEQINKNTFLPIGTIYNPILLQNYIIAESISDLFIMKQIEICLTFFEQENKQKYISNFKNQNKKVDLEWIPEIRDVSISGFLREKESGIGKADERIYASVFGKHDQIHINDTKEDGSFVFSLNHLEANHDIYIGYHSPDSARLELVVNNDFSTKYATYNHPVLAIDTSIKSYLEETFINHQILKTFNNSQDTIIEKDRKAYSTFGSPNISIKMSDYIMLSSMEEVFSEIIPAVQMRKRKGHYSCKMFDAERNVLYEQPLVLLDYVPVFNMDEIIKLSPSAIDQIDVYSRTCIYGDYVLEGILSITTKTENFAGYKFSTGSTFIEYKTKAFNLHKSEKTYQDEKLLTSRLPDFRTTLYWNPDLKIEEDTTISFYTSDHSGTYEVILNGFDKAGNVISGRTTFEVERR